MKQAGCDNTELNELRKISSVRKSEVSAERISVCTINENLVEHGIHCLPCSSQIISEMLPEIHKMKKVQFFFKPMIHSQMI